MKRTKTYRVSDVAGIAGVSVRTLHYYEEIGLLVPAARSGAGYRLYDTANLLRLQQILIGRTLALPLEEIRRSLDDPGFDHRAALLKQRKQLRQRARATAEMIRAVDRALALLDTDRKGNDMTVQDIFDGFNPADYDAEVEVLWESTDAYRESAKRTRHYGPEDWSAIKEEQAAIHRDAAAALRSGRNPAEDAVMDIAERHRLSIERWFYPCSTDMHCGLADLYQADGRFAAAIDQHGNGLTPFLAAAIRANARRGGTDPGTS